MKTENAMKTLNGARRAIGLSAQGIGCSQTVIVKTLKQLERDIGAEAVPKTVEVLKTMLGNAGLVSEKQAMISMDEINVLRADFRLRAMQPADEEIDVDQQDQDMGESGERPH